MIAQSSRGGVRQPQSIPTCASRWRHGGVTGKLTRSVIELYMKLGSSADKTGHIIMALGFSHKDVIVCSVAAAG
eukprot:6201461-Pleurochrysis_carterae.AAC.2